MLSFIFHDNINLIFVFIMSMVGWIIIISMMFNKMINLFLLANHFLNQYELLFLLWF